MVDTKGKSSRHNRTDAHMNAQTVAAGTGLVCTDGS